jgi:hypothetical protein
MRRLVYGYQIVAMSILAAVIALVVWQDPSVWKFALFVYGAYVATVLKDGAVFRWLRSLWRTRNQEVIAELFPLDQTIALARGTSVEYFRARNEHGDLVPAMRRSECHRPGGCSCAPENFARCPYYIVVIEQIDTIEPVEQAMTDPEKRSRALLRRLLTPQQRAYYDRTGLFAVPLKNGMVCMLGDGFIRWPNGHKQCVHPSGGVTVGGDLPATDSVIAQLLWLRNNPAGIAAVSRLLPDGSSMVARRR